jgi:hypothetical protein
MNKNLLLASGLIAIAVIIYVRKNKKPINVAITSIAPPKEPTAENSNICGACSGANGENWN